jgi:hypothetical protein
VTERGDKCEAGSSAHECEIEEDTSGVDDASGDESGGESGEEGS